jgi:antitoxin PrlF
MSIPTSALTNDGWITIPQEIRELLNLRPGDRIDFVIESEGRVYLQPSPVDVRELSGMLYQADRPPISLEAMEEAIAQGAVESL